MTDEPEIGLWSLPDIPTVGRDGEPTDWFFC